MPAQLGVVPSGPHSFTPRRVHLELPRQPRRPALEQHVHYHYHAADERPAIVIPGAIEQR